MVVVGQDAPDPISCMAMEGDAVWTASGSCAIKYLRGKEVSLSTYQGSLMLKKIQVGRVTNPLGTPLSSILIFGSRLLALTEDGSRMFIWGTQDGGNYPRKALESPV